MGAGFSPWEERTGPHPAPGRLRSWGWRGKTLPGAALHRTRGAPRLHRGWYPGLRPGGRGSGTRMPESALPGGRPPPPPPSSAEVLCSRAPVGRETPACVGQGGSLGAGVCRRSRGRWPAAISAQNFCLLGRLGPLLRRATPAISTGTGCLACTSHAKAFLLFAFLPRFLLKLSSCPRVAASLSRCSGCWRPLAPPPRLPRGFPGSGSPGPLGEPGWGGGEG